jgi:hypothetical protein
MPKLEEVKDRVRDEVIKQKARDLSRQKAGASRQLRGATDFDKTPGRRGRTQNDRPDLTRRANPGPGYRA